MEKFNQAFYNMIYEAGWHIKPTAKHYFTHSVSHNYLVRKDVDEQSKQRNTTG